MDNHNFNIDFSFLKTGFWLTILLGVLKIAKVINISNFLVFVPLLIGVASVFLMIFLIGLIILYLISVKDINPIDDNKKVDKDEEDS